MRAEDLVHGGALVRRREGGAFALLPGTQPIVVRHREERRAHQSAPRDRPDRPAGRRAVLADGPAERDGRARSRRHGDAAVGASRSRRTRASRRGRGAVGCRRRAREARARPRSKCSRRSRPARVRMIWIACTNPAQSLPDQATVRAGLERAELVVLQEAYTDTETAAFADVLLPATTWGEKDGTVTNSERRISRVRAAVPAPGEARDDWAIAVDFARRLEARLRPAYLRARRRCFPMRRPRDLWRACRDDRAGAISISRPFVRVLETRGPQQWPFPRGARNGPAAPLRRRRVRDAGRARALRGRRRTCRSRRSRDARYPFRLNTGRLRDQWHGMSRTGTVAQLFQNAGEPSLQLHPSDLARRGIAAGDLVRVESKRGSIVVPVEASAELKPGHAFLPMHWGSASLGGEGALGVNALTTRRVARIAAAGAEARGGAGDARPSCRGGLSAFGYACVRRCARVARTRCGPLLESFAVRQRHADRPRSARRAVSCGGGDAGGCRAARARRRTCSASMPTRCPLRRCDARHRPARARGR